MINFILARPNAICIYHVIVNNIIQELSKRLSVSEIQAMHRVIQFVIVLSLVLNTLAGIALYVIMYAFSGTREVA